MLFLYFSIYIQAGTKRYMSPEILQGSITFHQESLIKADMYSIGLVMWEMFSRTRINIETGIHNLEIINCIFYLGEQK